MSSQQPFEKWQAWAAANSAARRRPDRHRLSEHLSARRDAARGVEDALGEVERLLKRARAKGIPIFHIMHDAGPGSPYDIRAEIGQICDRATPHAGEPVIVKRHPNSFWETDLDARLPESGMKNLVLAGFMTNLRQFHRQGGFQRWLPPP